MRHPIRLTVILTSLSLAGLLAPGCTQLLSPKVGDLGSLRSSPERQETGSIVFRIGAPGAARQVAGLMDVVDSIDVQVSSSKLAATMSARILGADIREGKGSARFVKVPVGLATLLAEVKDSTGFVVASGSVDVTVLAGREVPANLTLTVPVTGSVAANINLVEATPTPAPVAEGPRMAPDDTGDITVHHDYVVTKNGVDSTFAYSGRIRSVIPLQSDHGFRSKAIGDSGPNRSPIPLSNRSRFRFVPESAIG